jgi:hypothetical protein
VLNNLLLNYKNCGIMAKEKSKTVKMDAANNSNVESQQKLSYEQLEQVAGNLNQQCKQMQSHIRSLQAAIAEFNEIGMLLDILGKSEHFHDEFVTRCSDKIEELVSKALDASEKQDEETK